MEENTLVPGLFFETILHIKCPAYNENNETLADKTK